jgi:hypothetical protein
VLKWNANLFGYIMCQEPYNERLDHWFHYNATYDILKWLVHDVHNNYTMKDLLGKYYNDMMFK